MKMKILIAAAIFLSLAGCGVPPSALWAELTGSAVSANDVYIAANIFDGLEISATSYDKLPLCVSGGTLACRTATGVKTVDAAVRAGIGLRKALLADVTANPNQTVPVSNYKALLAVISTIQSYTVPAGVSQ